MTTPDAGRVAVDEPRDNYAGFAPCGCMKIVASGSLEKRELAKAVSKIVRKGLRLDTVTTSFVRSGPSMFCHACRPEMAYPQPRTEG